MSAQNNWIQKQNIVVHSLMFLLSIGADDSGDKFRQKNGSDIGILKYSIENGSIWFEFAANYEKIH